ncbi:MAG: tetratricopeptide repeat protein, partial [Gemmatimonadota bacterium]|nr:tetratricopeptide repeat protein [Gemmatimonadota bacterium]
ILDDFPLDAFEAADRQTLAFANFFARAGEPGRARGLLDRWEEDRIAGDPTPFSYLETRALIDLAEGEVAAAVEALKRLDEPAPGRCLRCVAFDLGLAHDRVGDSDAAIEAYERHVAMDHPLKLFPGHVSIPLALERLGQLYEARAGESENPTDDLAKAAEYYRRFVELWSDADEELQSRVRAARARLEAIDGRAG